MLGKRERERERERERMTDFREKRQKLSITMFYESFSIDFFPIYRMI